MRYQEPHHFAYDILVGFRQMQNLPDLMLKLYPLILRPKETSIMMFLCWSMII